VNEQPRVMVVEDEAIIALDIQRQLTIAGFAVAGKAQTAESAFQQIEQERPDIVLMDIRLKGEMDGVQAASIIRDRYALPVIYLTAHTDGPTLERARETAPFGYLVKPLVNTSVKATITMALHKHRMERELENSRKLLSNILHSLPDAVLVARTTGEVLFLNQLAERTTGWTLQEAAGKSLFQVAAIQNHDGAPMTLQLLQKIGGEGSATVRIPPHSILVTKEGKRIDIAGQLSVMTVENRVAGVFMTLQDVTVQNREDQRVRQEQQMFVAGELANGIALEFYSLFGLIDDAMLGLSKSPEKADLDLIRKASDAGTNMSTQLLELREGNGAAHVVNVTQYVRSAQTLLQQICGKDVKLQIASELDLGYVLSTGNHFEQLLVNLVMEGKKRLEGLGTLTISVDLHMQAVSSFMVGSFIRLSVRAERFSNAALPQGESLPLATDLPGVGLTIVRTIAIASEGFTRVTEPNDSVTLIEVFLPRHESRVVAAAAANEHSQVVLFVAMPQNIIQSLRANLGKEAMLLGASSPDEAAWISELYEGDIDLVVLNAALISADGIERARNRIRSRRPHITFVETNSAAGASAAPAELMDYLTGFLESKPMIRIGSAN
jgi:PAS domain S-box-containing protein